MIVEMGTAFAAAQVADAALVDPPGAWIFACSKTFASQALMVCLPAGLNGSTVVRKSCVFSSLSPSVSMGLESVSDSPHDFRSCITSATLQIGLTFPAGGLARYTAFMNLQIMGC